MGTAELKSGPQSADYRLREQYGTSANLAARINLHRRFSTNRYGWNRWVFDRILLSGGKRVLELGCGTAALWSASRSRLPADWRITLTDLSSGMLRESRQAIRTDRRFSTCAASATDLPFNDGAFDLVVANHMLYHVPNRPKSFAEIRRVLRRGGKLYATTNGLKHMKEVDPLFARFFTGAWSVAYVANQFGLENGGQQMQPFFANITLERYEDSLLVTEAEPLLAYVLSMRSAQGALAADAGALRVHLQDQLNSRGAIQLTKDSGIFTATRD